MSLCVRSSQPPSRPTRRVRAGTRCKLLIASAIGLSLLATDLSQARAASVPTTHPATNSTQNATQNSTTAPIEQSAIDAAMTRLRQRQQARASAPTPSTEPTTPTTKPANVVSRPSSSDEPDYSRDGVASRKQELLAHYEADLARARAALRRHETTASAVRELGSEMAALQILPLEKFRDLVMEADGRNTARIGRYREAFGALDDAARTVVIVLMKSGLIDTAAPLPDDPLSEELELARGVRRVYYSFVLPVPRESTTPARRHNGYVEFQLAAAQGLWLPTWADLEGDPIPLFDAEAFLPLRPYRIFYDGQAFVVAQQPTQQTAPLFALITPRNGWTFGFNNGIPGFGRNSGAGPKRYALDR